MDPLTPEQRRYTMSRVHGKDTKTELLVRGLLYKLGYRYRLQGRDLPGNPDIVFRSKKKVIFIHGCFWHGHDCRSGKKQPKTNEEYWLPKLAKTRARDAQNQTKLLELAWDYLILWECQLKDKEALTEKIRKFMGGKCHD